MDNGELGRRGGRISGGCEEPCESGNTRSRLEAGFMGLTKFQGGQARQRAPEGKYPETKDDLGFRPPLLLKMMMDRRHQEDPPALAKSSLGVLEVADLRDDGQHLHHEHAARDHQRERLMYHESHD